MMNVYPLWLLSGISWCTLLCFPQLFAKASDTDGSSVRINEVMASNGITIADEDGDYEDWIELYNAGDASVNLGGWGLSDNYTNPFKWTFPENTILEKGDFLLVWASGKNRTSVDPAIDGDGATGSGEFHTNFAIAASGEEVLLTNPEGVRVDELGPREIPRNMSVGRVPDGTGEWFYFNESTPASPNDSTAYTEVLKAPGLSHTAGFYHEAVSLEATHERTDVALRYTLDGSEPTADSPEFPPQLVLASGEGDPNVFSAIKTTAGSDFWREPEFPVFKGNVVRVRAFRNGAMPSRTVSGTYFIGDSVSARYSLPVISVVTDGDNFFGDAKGIYVAGDGYDGDWQNSNYSQRGREWERPVHLEIFEKDGALALAQDAGARIHGGWSRRWAFKSLRFYARSDYGENTFDYQLFPDQPDDSYKRFIIRNSGNDHEFTLFRDAFMQRFVGHMNFDTQAYRPSIIFINGEYWGIKNMRERYDRFYLERTHGVDPNNIDLMTDIRTVKEGDASHYDALLEAIETHGVSDPERYYHVRRQMDVENFIDYNIANIYLNNTDWPGANIDFWRLRTDGAIEEAPYGHDGRWRWMLFDTDFGFWQHDDTQGHPSFNTLDYATIGLSGESGKTPESSRFLLRNLLENDSFRTAFITRFADQLNTAFQPERVISMIDEMAAVVEPEVPEHILRFGRPFSNNWWRTSVERMRSFGEQRPEYQYGHIIDHFELSGSYRLTVDVNATEQGRVRVNTLTLDGGTPGVSDAPYPWTGRYFHGVPVELEAIAEPGYHFVGWQEFGSDHGALTRVDPQGALEATADFEEIDPGERQLAFNDLHPVGQAGQPLMPFTVSVRRGDGDTDILFEGDVTLEVEDGPGGISGTLNQPTTGGRAVFPDVVPEAIGTYILRATANDATGVISEPLTVAALAELVLPRYMQGDQDANNDNNDRVPFAFRLRIEGLRPNTTYRYGNRIITAEDPPDQNGAGNAILITGADTDWIRNTDSPRFRAEDLGKRHLTFTTDREGSATAWFVTEPTGNPRFAPGNTVFVRVLLNDGKGGEEYHHYLTAPSPIEVLRFGE